jgi:GABA permease
MHETAHLLVVANETLETPGLVDAVEGLLAPGGDVLVVCPVLVGRSRYWTSDLASGIERAHERLRGSLAGLRERGIESDGIVGDGHPLLAIEDALRAYAADHILIVTHPPARSIWLERKLITRARARFDVPISHAIGQAALPMRGSVRSSHAFSSAGGSGRLSQ